MSNNTTLLEDVMGTLLPFVILLLCAIAPVAMLMTITIIAIAAPTTVAPVAVTEAVTEEVVTEAEAVTEAEVVTEAEAVTEEVMTAAIVMVTPYVSTSTLASSSSSSAILTKAVATKYRSLTSFEISQGYIVNVDGQVKIKDVFGQSVIEVLTAKNVPYHAVSSNKIKIAYYGPNGYFVGDIRVTKDDDKCYCEINRSSGCSGACTKLYTMIQAKFSSEVPTKHTELFLTPLEVPEELLEIVPESSPEEKFGPFLWMLNAEFSDVSEQGLMALAKTAENSVLARDMFKYTVLFDAICKHISSTRGKLCCMYSIITLSLIARAIAQDKEQIAVLKEKLSESSESYVSSESSVSSVFENLMEMATKSTKDSSLYDLWKAKYCSDILGVLNAVFVTSVY
jgi:hypothetical protein